jgi:hypothetical protein
MEREQQAFNSQSDFLVSRLFGRIVPVAAVPNSAHCTYGHERDSSEIENTSIKPARTFLPELTGRSAAHRAALRKEISRQKGTDGEGKEK